MLVLCDFLVLHTHDAQREAQLNKTWTIHTTHYHSHSYNVGLSSTILKLRVSCSHTVNILIHTDVQVGPCLDETQLLLITLTFKPTWGPNSHIHSTKVM